jgi:N-acetylmuramic acid 6-phosphate (MurNAc-6-P) etherase
MRRFIAAIAAAGALALSATTAFANSAAIHYSFDATGMVIACGDHSYTVASGTVNVVEHVGTSASGNLNVTATLTPDDVVLVDASGNVYSLAGALWFGGSLNARTGGLADTDTSKIQILSQGGGTVDSLNVVFHISPNGDITSLDFGTCTL